MSNCECCAVGLTPTLVDVFRRQPDLFAHWRFGTRSDGWTMGRTLASGAAKNVVTV
jgi:hypothetical protein